MVQMLHNRNNSDLIRWEKRAVLTFSAMDHLVGDALSSTAKNSRNSRNSRNTKDNLITKVQLNICFRLMNKTYVRPENQNRAKIFAIFNRVIDFSDQGPVYSAQSPLPSSVPNSSLSLLSACEKVQDGSSAQNQELQQRADGEEERSFQRQDEAAASSELEVESEKEKQRDKEGREEEGEEEKEEGEEKKEEGEEKKGEENGEGEGGDGEGEEEKEEGEKEEGEKEEKEEKEEEEEKESESETESETEKVSDMGTEDQEEKIEQREQKGNKVEGEEERDDGVDDEEEEEKDGVDDEEGEEEKEEEEEEEKEEEEGEGEKREERERQEAKEEEEDLDSDDGVASGQLFGTGSSEQVSSKEEPCQFAKRIQVEEMDGGRLGVATEKVSSLQGATRQTSPSLLCKTQTPNHRPGSVPSKGSDVAPVAADGVSSSPSPGPSPDVLKWQNRQKTESPGSGDARQDVLMLAAANSALNKHSSSSGLSPSPTPRSRGLVQKPDLEFSGSDSGHEDSESGSDSGSEVSNSDSGSASDVSGPGSGSDSGSSSDSDSDSDSDSYASSDSDSSSNSSSNSSSGSSSGSDWDSDSESDSESETEEEDEGLDVDGADWSRNGLSFSSADTSLSNSNSGSASSGESCSDGSVSSGESCSDESGSSGDSCSDASDRQNPGKDRASERRRRSRAPVKTGARSRDFCSAKNEAAKNSGFRAKGAQQRKKARASMEHFDGLDTVEPEQRAGLLQGRSYGWGSDRERFGDPGSDLDSEDGKYRGGADPVLSGGWADGDHPLRRSTGSEDGQRHEERSEERFEGRHEEGDRGQRESGDNLSGSVTAAASKKSGTGEEKDRGKDEGRDKKRTKKKKKGHRSRKKREGRGQRRSRNKSAKEDGGSDGKKRKKKRKLSKEELAKRMKEIQWYYQKANSEEKHQFKQSRVWVMLASRVIETLSNAFGLEAVHTHGLTENIENSMNSGEFNSAMEACVTNPEASRMISNPIASFGATFMDVLMQTHMGNLAGKNKGSGSGSKTRGKKSRSSDRTERGESEDDGGAGPNGRADGGSRGQWTDGRFFDGPHRPSENGYRDRFGPVPGPGQFYGGYPHAYPPYPAMYPPFIPALNSGGNPHSPSTAAGHGQVHPHAAYNVPVIPVASNPEVVPANNPAAETNVGTDVGTGSKDHTQVSTAEENRDLETLRSEIQRQNQDHQQEMQEMKGALQKAMAMLEKRSEQLESVQLESERVQREVETQSRTILELQQEKFETDRELELLKTERRSNVSPLSSISDRSELQAETDPAKSTALPVALPETDKPNAEDSPVLRPVQQFSKPPANSREAAVQKLDKVVTNIIPFLQMQEEQQQLEEEQSAAMKQLEESKPQFDLFKGTLSAY